MSLRILNIHGHLSSSHRRVPPSLSAERTQDSELILMRQGREGETLQAGVDVYWRDEGAVGKKNA